MKDGVYVVTDERENPGVPVTAVAWVTRRDSDLQVENMSGEFGQSLPIPDPEDLPGSFDDGDRFVIALPQGRIEFRWANLATFEEIVDAFPDILFPPVATDEDVQRVLAGLIGNVV